MKDDRETRRRVRREDPRREDPIRNWWNLFRQAQAGSGRGGESTGNGQKERPVDRGVRMGYKLIEEQIRQGQRAAEEMNNRSYGIDSMNRDFQELAVRSMRYYVDAASLFMDLFSTMPGNLATPFRSNGTTNAAGNAPTNGAAGAASPRVDGSAPVATRVVSESPATVTVDLKQDLAQRPLKIAGLHAIENGAPPITAISFSHSVADGGPVLQVEVPAGQPAGLYAGVLIDPRTGETGGTVSLRLGP